MKKKLILNSLLASIIFICSSLEGNAQVKKGDMNVGFSSSVTTQSGSFRNLNITALISAERYFTDNISVGFGPLLSIITSEGSLTSIYGLNVFGNYNFLTPNGKFMPYVGILGSINQSISNSDSRSYSNQTQSISSGNTTVSFYGAGAKAGTKYFLTEKINLDVNVNYASNIYAKVNGERLDFGEGGQIQIFLGLGFIFGKKEI